MDKWFDIKISIKFNRVVNNLELKELMKLVELQDTNMRFTSTSLYINGDDAPIEVDIDEDGNITVL